MEIESYAFDGFVGRLRLSGNSIRIVRSHAFSNVLANGDVDLNDAIDGSVEPFAFDGLVVNSGKLDTYGSSGNSLSMRGGTLGLLPPHAFTGLAVSFALQLGGVTGISRSAFDGCRANAGVTFYSSSVGVLPRGALSGLFANVVNLRQANVAGFEAGALHGVLDARGGPVDLDLGPPCVVGDLSADVFNNSAFDSLTLAGVSGISARTFRNSRVTDLKLFGSVERIESFAMAGLRANSLEISVGAESIASYAFDDTIVDGWIRLSPPLSPGLPRRPVRELDAHAFSNVVAHGIDLSANELSVVDPLAFSNASIGPGAVDTSCHRVRTVVELADHAADGVEVGDSPPPYATLVRGFDASAEGPGCRAVVWNATGTGSYVEIYRSVGNCVPQSGGSSTCEVSLSQLGPSQFGSFVAKLEPFALQGVTLSGDFWFRSLSIELPAYAFIGFKIFGSLKFAESSITRIGSDVFTGAVLGVVDMRGAPIKFVDMTLLASDELNGVTVLFDPPTEDMCLGSGTGITRVQAWGSARVCTTCLAGNYCPEEVQNEVPCPAGRFNGDIGASSLESCKGCPAGTFGDFAGASRGSDCSYCPIGRFNIDTAASSIDDCLLCAPGRYAAATGLAECSACPPGTFMAKAGSYSASDCELCPPNTYSATPGAGEASACEECPPAAPYSPEGSGSLSDCSTERIVPLSCAPGSAYDFDVEACSPCEAGHECPGDRAAPRPCAAGHYADHPGRARCTACSPGRFSTAVQATEATTCQSCPQGTFSDLGGLASASGCAYCPIGRAGLAPGGASLADCEPCGPGTYSPAPGLGECTRCPAGTFLQSSGAVSVSQCELCPPNTYSTTLSGTNSSVCLQCPEGAPHADAGSPSLESCSADEADVTCLSGYYYDSGTEDCRPCAPGYACVGGAVAATPCPAGHFSSAPEMTACTPCPAGTFSAAIAATSASTCQQCHVGFVALEAGSAACSTCNSWEYAAADATHCESCDGTPSAMCLPGGTGPLSPAAVARIRKTQPAFGTAGAKATRPLVSANSQVFVDRADDSRSLASAADVDVPQLVIVIVAGAACVAALGLRRALPDLVKQFDLFSLAHKVGEGDYVMRRKTRAGAILSAFFGVCVILLTLNLLTAPNTAVTTSLVTRSSATPTPTGNASTGPMVSVTFQMLWGTSRPSEQRSLCSNDNVAVVSYTGLSNLQTELGLSEEGGCELQATCESCSIDGGTGGAIQVRLPLQFQAIAFNVSATSELVESYAASALFADSNAHMLLAASNVMQLTVVPVSLIVADGSVEATGYSLMGTTSSVQLQPALGLTVGSAASQDVSIELHFADVVTEVSEQQLQTSFQRLAAIVSAVVSTFGAFASLFASSELGAEWAKDLWSRRERRKRVATLTRGAQGTELTTRQHKNPMFGQSNTKGTTPT